MSDQDRVIRKGGQWHVRVVLPGKTRATTLSRHDDALEARVKLAQWREDLYGDIEQCLHDMPWHQCPECSTSERTVASRTIGPAPQRTHVGGYAAAEGMYG